MDKLWSALGQAAVWGTLGLVVDRLMRIHEYRAVERRLTDWWVWIEEVRLIDFGKKEAQYAIGLLDKYAGAKFWSRRRLTFTAGAVLFALIAALADRLLYGAAPLTYTYPLIISSPTFWSAICLTFMSFAVSISVTRGISSLVVHFSNGPISTFILFVAALVIHVFLLFSWTLFVSHLVQKAYLLSWTLLFEYSEFFWAVAIVLREAWNKFYSGIQLALNGDFVSLWYAMIFGHSSIFDDSLVAAYTKAILDVLSYGLRILFSVAFLVSLLLRNLIKEFASRVVEAMVNTRAPFAILFGGIGGLIAVIQWFMAPN